MRKPALTAYSFFFPVIAGMARLFAPFSPRLRNFFTIRDRLFEDLEQQLSGIPPAQSRLWVHAASVGEFEQARPVITALKEKYPDLSVVVSFFSDSGFNSRRNYPDADAVFYLPADNAANAKRLVKLLDPDIMMLMRYDFWPNHLMAAKTHGTKLVLAAAVLQSASPYRNPILRGFYRSVFTLFDRIWTVSDKDATAFRQLFGCVQAETAGDPRFDQVIRRSGETGKVENFRKYFADRTVLVGGSVWEKDETLLVEAWTQLQNKPDLILVPHKVDPENIDRLCGFLESRSIACSRASALGPGFDPERSVLVVDLTGFLLELYSIASIAYVGGGFGVNVHNTLEPAVYGIPVLFGPRIHNSPEAEALVETGGGTIVETAEELKKHLEAFTNDPHFRNKAGSAASRFVNERKGATQYILKGIETLLEA
ncbi:MAG: 3-deoxy-D-manno-octulosonic acid transferase [Chlorobiaceae bacterium]|nr:3-deoxy-D-manno-octulosonic acid transferase [Chlorobiaceae bacterium]